MLESRLLVMETRQVEYQRGLDQVQRTTTAALTRIGGRVDALDVEVARMRTEFSDGHAKLQGAIEQLAYAVDGLKNNQAEQHKAAMESQAQMLHLLQGQMTADQRISRAVDNAEVGLNSHRANESRLTKLALLASGAAFAAMAALGAVLADTKWLIVLRQIFNGATAQ